MHYEGNVIRPPSEARSLIIQVTVGCSHNRCTFCGTYKDYPFRVKDLNLVRSDIDEAARHGIGFRRAFFADGDALILPTDDLVDLFVHTKKKHPSIERIGVYGNTKALLKKTVDELVRLREAGLGIIYQGIETGHEPLLRKIQKGALPKHMIEAARKVRESGILLSQTVLLGLGGLEMSREHARDTGNVLTDMQPDYASALTLMLLPNTPLYRDMQEGNFTLPDRFELLAELREIINRFSAERPCLFTSNHASNYLPLKAELPGEKASLLRLLDKVLESRDESVLKPEYLRAL